MMSRVPSRRVVLGGATAAGVALTGLRHNSNNSRPPQGFRAGFGAYHGTLDGGKLYANNQAAGTVTVVDLVKRRPLAVLTGFAQPRQGVMLSPAQDSLYVTNFLGDRVTKVSTATNQRIAEIGGFQGIRGLSISRDGRRLYAANSVENAISFVDTASGATLRQVPVGQDPYGAALAPDESLLFSGNLKDNSLTAVDPADGTVLGTVTGLIGPRQAIHFSNDSKTAWVLNMDLTIAVVNVERLKVVRTIGDR